MRPKKRRDWLKALASRHEDWMLVDEDESWFSRFAQPAAHAWAAPKEALRLVEEQPPAKEPHPLACYGGGTRC
jgi:hypothetical protein